MKLNTLNTENWMSNLFNRDFINQEYCDEDFANAYLDQRDTDPFDAKWVQADKQLEANTAQHFSKEETQEIEEIKTKWRTAFFEKVIKKTHHADLSAYISEDIELITGYMLTGIENDFVRGMIEAFENNELPA